jgi:hypothetical protein
VISSKLSILSCTCWVAPVRQTNSTKVLQTEIWVSYIYLMDPCVVLFFASASDLLLSRGCMVKSCRAMSLGRRCPASAIDRQLAHSFSGTHVHLMSHWCAHGAARIDDVDGNILRAGGAAPPLLRVHGDRARRRLVQAPAPAHVPPAVHTRRVVTPSHGRGRPWQDARESGRWWRATSQRDTAATGSGNPQGAAGPVPRAAGLRLFALVRHAWELASMGRRSTEQQLPIGYGRRARAIATPTPAGVPRLTRVVSGFAGAAMGVITWVPRARCCRICCCGRSRRKKITRGTAAQRLRADAAPMLDAWTWRAS